MINIAAHSFHDATAIKLPQPAMAIAPMLAARGLHSSAIRKVACNETLWCEGDERSHIFVVRTGAVCLSRTLPNGRRIVLDFAYPGDIIGLGADTQPCDAHTVQLTRLEAIPVAAFKRAVAEDPEFGRQASIQVANALSAAYQHVVVISKLSANERLASFLMALSRRNEAHGLSGASVVLPMKRLDIADFLGLTIETVSRTFTRLREAGLIALDQHNVVVFRDLARLRALAAGEGEHD
ncbi:MAG: Crp/Fnr family transcriptional regulator [Hyphomicrobiales bacterium]|jgi:CRP/FNR family transcriptional regulator, anaerobic regulatory protein|nr:Crp/Fnr family transcriptional regulator [Hyphomicrobiales bacterium]